MGSLVRVGHSPDPDDAFMFYALAFRKFDTAPEEYEHCLLDIETLNRKAEAEEFEVTALSFHGYAYVADRYELLPCGGSFGDGYGPVLVAREAPRGAPRSWLAGKRIAVPGLRTSAWLALQLFARGFPKGEAGGAPRFEAVATPFDQVMAAVWAGRADGGLLIHEGQLTYAEPSPRPLSKVVDLGAWWKAQTGLPLPLGGNAVLRKLPPARRERIAGHVLASIQWALAHRAEALGYALRYARGIAPADADRFVGMYVNAYTLDWGEEGRRAVELFLDAGRQAGLIYSPSRA